MVPQEIKADSILAIGDSITAYFSKTCSGCCQSYSDYASIQIDEYVQNEAVSGTRLSGGIYEGLQRDDCVALAFYSDSGNVGGFVGSRVTCVRHIMEGTANRERRTVNGER